MCCILVSPSPPPPFTSIIVFSHNALFSIPPLFVNRLAVSVITELIQPGSLLVWVTACLDMPVYIHVYYICVCVCVCVCVFVCFHVCIYVFFSCIFVALALCVSFSHYHVGDFFVLRPDLSIKPASPTWLLHIAMLPLTSVLQNSFKPKVAVSDCKPTMPPSWDCH